MLILAIDFAQTPSNLLAGYQLIIKYLPQLPNTSPDTESFMIDIRLEAAIKSQHTGKIDLITGHKVTL